MFSCKAWYLPLWAETYSLLLTEYFYTVNLFVKFSLFFDVTQRPLVVSYRCFGTPYRTHLQGSCSSRKFDQESHRCANVQPHKYSCVQQQSFYPYTYKDTMECHSLTFKSLLFTWCTNSLTFNNCTLCPHCIYVFCIYLRTNNDLCHLQHKLIGFYNRREKCLQRGTDWVFK